MKNIVNFLKQVPTWKAFAKKFDELDSLVGSKGVKSKEVNRILEELSHQVDKYGSLLLKVTNLIDELMSYADNKYIIEGATVRLKDIAHSKQCDRINLFNIINHYDEIININNCY